MAPALEALVALALGGVVGFGDLASRYRDAPFRILRYRWTWIFVVINAAIALFAFALAVQFGWTFGAAVNVSLWQAIVAGAGAMAIIRGGVKLRFGDDDTEIGLARAFQAILDALDGEVGRAQGRALYDAAAEITSGLSYTKTKSALPLFCLSTMQHLPPSAGPNLAKAVEVLDASGASDGVRVKLLAVELLKVVGDGALRQAVQSLGNELKD